MKASAAQDGPRLLERQARERSRIGRGVPGVAGGGGMAPKSDVVQVRNPKTGRYVKIDRATGKILGHKKSAGPYKNIPLASEPPARPR